MNGMNGMNETERNERKERKERKERNERNGTILYKGSERNGLHKERNFFTRFGPERPTLVHILYMIFGLFISFFHVINILIKCITYSLKYFCLFKVRS